MICTNCGYDGGDSTYCARCSHPLLAVCPKGHPSQPGNRYCPSCQAPISIQPAVPSLWIGCVSRILAWVVTLGIVAIVGHLAHHLTIGAVIGVLGFFGVEPADIDRAFSVLVVVPCVIALVSFMIPGTFGPAVRKALWWLMAEVIWPMLKGLGRAIWFLAEGSRHGETSGRKS